MNHQAKSANEKWPLIHCFVIPGPPRIDPRQSADIFYAPVIVMTVDRHELSASLNKHVSK